MSTVPAPVKWIPSPLSAHTLQIKEFSQRGSLSTVLAFIASCQDIGNGPLIGFPVSWSPAAIIRVSLLQEQRCPCSLVNPCKALLTQPVSEGTAVYTCHSSTCQAPGHSELEASMGYKVRFLSRTKQNKNQPPTNQPNKPLKYMYFK